MQNSVHNYCHMLCVRSQQLQLAKYIHTRTLICMDLSANSTVTLSQCVAYHMHTATMKQVYTLYICMGVGSTDDLAMDIPYSSQSHGHTPKPSMFTATL